MKNEHIEEAPQPSRQEVAIVEEKEKEDDMIYLDKEDFMNEYAQWKRVYHDFLNRRTVHKDGKSYYLHRRLRSAMNSLDYYLPYLYTYQRPECEDAQHEQ